MTRLPLDMQDASIVTMHCVTRLDETRIRDMRRTTVAGTAAWATEIVNRPARP